MNKNEECLLKFLENQGRLDKTLDELERFIFSNMPKQGWFSDLGKSEEFEANVISENRIINSQPTCYNIINKEFTFCKTANRIKNESA